MNTTKTLSVIALALLLTACGGGKPHPVAITLESDQPEDTALLTTASSNCPSATTGTPGNAAKAASIPATRTAANRACNYAT